MPYTSLIQPCEVCVVWGADVSVWNCVEGCVVGCVCVCVYTVEDKNHFHLPS